MKKRIIIGGIWGLLIVLAMFDVRAADEQLVLIGHKDVADSLKKEDIKQIFLGRKTRWANDEKILFVVFAEKSTYTTFLKEYVGKTVFQYKNYWKKQVFTGKGRMPKTFKTSEEVIKYVSSTEGAISFAMSQDVPDDDSVKIIAIEN
jgi:ABC-type phosphate transport system substrate-binding protein